MKSLRMLAILALVAGCASAPEPAMTASPADAMVAAEPVALDPVGSYVVSASVQGMAVSGQMGITGTAGDWDGSLYTDMTGELNFTSITVDGQELRLRANTPDGPLSMRLVFTGDTFTGDWSLGAEGGELRGRRVDS